MYWASAGCAQKSSALGALKYRDRSIEGRNQAELEYLLLNEPRTEIEDNLEERVQLLERQRDALQAYLCDQWRNRTHAQNIDFLSREPVSEKDGVCEHSKSRVEMLSARESPRRKKETAVEIYRGEEVARTQGYGARQRPRYYNANSSPQEEFDYLGGFLEFLGMLEELT